MPVRCRRDAVRMFLKSLLCTLVLTGCSSSLAFAIPYGHSRPADHESTKITVPRAPPRVILVGDPSSIERPPPNEIVLTLPQDDDGSIRKPSTVNELVEILSLALPAEHRRGLAWHFGFAARGSAPRLNRQQLRLGDLDWFLTRLFDLGNESTPLGREIACLSSGEGSLAPIHALIVRREIRSPGYSRRKDVPKDMNVHAALATAERLTFVCGQGINR